MDDDAVEQVDDRDQGKGHGKLRIFVYEHITGGGLAAEPLPPSLAAEGELMLRALVDDLTALPDVEVVVSRDARLPPPAAAPVRSIVVAAGSRLDAVLDAGCALADAVWPIAPESGGILEDVVRRVAATGLPLLACSPAAIGIAASKFATAQILAAAGVPVVPTRRDPREVDAARVVVKPDDGAGCLDTRVLDRAAAVAGWDAARARSHVVQPFVAGDAISLSLLCAGGRAEILCGNRQHVVERAGVLEFGGVLVNAGDIDRAAYAALADAITAALPGLWGYVGVDLIESADGPRVVDVNPRLTTAYAGLGRALGINVAARVLELRRPQTARAALPAGSPVDLRIDHER